jgi:hypothetical protein
LHTIGTIRNILIPALKRIQIDRYGVDVELDSKKSVLMKQAYAYCKAHCEEDEAGGGNPFMMIDWKYVSSTLPTDSPDYWRDSLVLFFPLITAGRCITLANFRDKDLVSIEKCIDDDVDNNDDDSDSVVVVGNKTPCTYKLVLNLRVTKNDSNWNKK